MKLCMQMSISFNMEVSWVGFSVVRGFYPIPYSFEVLPHGHFKLAIIFHILYKKLYILYIFKQKLLKSLGSIPTDNVANMLLYLFKIKFIKIKINYNWR